MREDLPSTFAKYRAAANKASHRVQVSAILAATDNCWEWCNGTCDHCRTTEDIRNSYGAMVGHVDAQESIPFVADYAGQGYFNDLDMLILGNMSSPQYAGPGLTPAEAEAHIALWAVLKSPMLLSCDVRSLTKETVSLLTNEEMLRIFNDSLALQARRIATTTGSASPRSVTFDACGLPGRMAPPLKRQKWVITKEGNIASLPSVSSPYQRTLTLQNCGGSRGQRLQLCSNDPKSHEPGCNTSCPTANVFNVSSMASAKVPTTIVSAYNQMCVEGMLGPGRSSVCTNKCAPGNIKQAWTLHPDGTLRASNNRTEQCLTAEPGLPTPASASTMDVFATPLANGDVAVLFFNREADTASATIALAALPGDATTWTAANVMDVWTSKTRPKATASLASGQVLPHGVAFLRLSKA
jgi:hypothetical protein